MRRTSGRLCTEDMWMEAPSAGHPGGGTAGAGLGSWAPASSGPAAGSRAPAPSRCSRRRLHADRRPTCRTRKLPLRAAFQVSAPCQSEPGTKRLGGLAPTRPELRRGPRLPRPPQAAFCVACFASGDAGARHAAGNRASAFLSARARDGRGAIPPAARLPAAVSPASRCTSHPVRTRPSRTRSAGLIAAWQTHPRAAESAVKTTFQLCAGPWSRRRTPFLAHRAFLPQKTLTLKTRVVSGMQ